MQFSQLATVRQHIHVGAPLPFNVRDADAKLLLARGQVIGSQEQMEALCKRGALVDIAELRATAQAVRQARPEELPGLWNQCMTQVGQTLLDSRHERFTQALDEVSAPVLELIERDSDLAIFQVLRQDTSEFTRYGINHSVHAGITSFLVAQRLGWSAVDLQKVFKAALTMNIAMLELQGQLAAQREPPTLAQSQQIFDHPRLSAEMLQLSGVTDSDWLDAVRQHHETPDGGGYPMGLSQVSDFAALIRRVDVYTAKLSARRGRDSIAADRAGRMMFMQEPGHPMTAALVKEFGVYPPGCFVRLVSGEIGVVVKRGPTVMTPVVAALTTAGGGHLLEPVRRDTSQREYAVAAVMGGREPKPRLRPEKLMALVSA